MNQLLAVIALTGIAHATTPQILVLDHQLAVTPEVKKAFPASDAIEIREIVGTADKFPVGGSYRVTGICRQSSLKNAVLYLGNSAEAGPEAITPLGGSSLMKTLPDGSTEFTYTFQLLRPGLLHLTVYDLDNHNRQDNSYAGVYLGDVVFKR